MAASERASEPREQSAEGEQGGEESGTRCRPDDELTAWIELDEDDEVIELVQVVTRHRRARVPPPPPRSTYRGPLGVGKGSPPRLPLQQDRIDFDALVEVARSSMPLGTALEPTTWPAPLDSTALSTPRAKSAPPLSRPQWGVAIVVGTTGLVVGALTAVALTVSRPSPGPTLAEQQEVDTIGALPGTPPAARAEPAPSRPMPEPPPAPKAELAPSRPMPAPPPTAEAENASSRSLARSEEGSRPPRPGASAPSRAARRAVAAPSAPQGERAPEQSAPARADAEPREAPPDDEEAPSEARPRADALSEAAPRADEEAPSEVAAALPELPARAEVDAAVNAILPALRTCGENLDLVNLELHFAPTGWATSVVVDAQHLSPTQRSCLARAARIARVPPFGGRRLTVRYPVRL